MKKIILFILLVAIFAIGKAQDYSGYSTGNYTGVNGVFFNPANIADNRYKWDFNLIGINAGLGNNNASFSLGNIGKSFKNIDSTLFGKSANATSAIANLDILGPSVMFNVAPKTTIALTTRMRTVLNIKDVDGQLIQSIQDNIDAPHIALNSTNNQRIIGNAWADFGLSVGQVLYKENHHFLKGGLTVKYLAGMANTYVNISNFSGQADKGTLPPNIGDTYIHNATGTAAIGISGASLDKNFKSSDLFKFKSSGIGFDLGFVYEYRPNDTKVSRSENKYKFKVSVALLDVGSIKYTPDTTNSAAYNAHVTGSTETASDVFYTKDINGKSLSEVKSYLDGRTDIFTKVSTPKAYKASLPTTIQLAVDYHIHRGFYVNLAGQLNGTKKDDLYGASYYNAISLTPRYEGKVFGLYIPISYNQLTNFNAGLSFRAGPLYIGSGSILSALAGNSKQADFHFGLKFGSLKRRERKHPDSIAVEKIVQVPVVEKKADTVVVAKDSDGDGVLDSLDKCPTVPGLAKYYGCPVPDTDGDGVNDEMDSCINVPGLAKYHGCPIPDTDGDGINDEVDKCPTVAGLAKYGGCPIPDTDGDGVNDEQDSCVTVPGSPKYHGCPIPDTDGDGINDELDKCPGLKGPASNNGCPVIQKEIIKKVNLAAKGLLFQTGKSVILKKSYPALNNVVQLLKANPVLNLSIEGYTDSLGNHDKNMKLSTDRANAAKAYFVKKGIVESRITAQGFGDAKPIASNKTPAGRLKNRRVVFTLSN